YPVRAFRDYITIHDFQILQRIGEGVSEKDYLLYLGRRIELGLLLTEAKKNYEIAEARIKKQKQQNENTTN
ncbi:MAG: hypothetical protein PHQ35_11280, partial [Phycisphaerae bacterium]|nr:hypothetical protein [Phycisphaerae bacterium]